VNGSVEGQGAFWAFSLRLYALSGVQQLLLQLQDDEDADVTTLLYILWRASCGYRLNEEALTLIEQRTRQWRDGIIKPLRMVRRAMKELATGSPAAEALRKQVKEAELEAERLLQSALEAQSASVPEAREFSNVVAARAGLSAYAAMIGFTMPDSVSAALVAALVTMSAELPAAVVSD
jgi:uncharacterized protein (TIGR02444 family)